MAERSAHDDVLAERIWAVRHDLIDIDVTLTTAWSKVTLVDADPAYRAKTAERCLASARQLTDLAQLLTQPNTDRT